MAAVAQGIGAFQIHLAAEEPVSHEGFDLAIEHVEAAEQMQFLHHRPGEPGDDAAIIGHSDAVEHRGVGDLAIRNVPKDDFPLFLRTELPIGHQSEGHARRVQVGEILVFPEHPRREHGDLDIQGLQILFRIVPIHLHHQRRLGAGAFAHGLAFQLHAFGLDGFDKGHERLGTDDADILLDIARIHPAQPPAQGLLRQNIALGRVGPQAHDGGDVFHVPAFLEHQHRDDGLARAVRPVDAVGLAAQLFQLLLGLARGGLADFAVVLGVDDQNGLLIGKLRVGGPQIVGHVVAVAGVVGHDEKDGLLAHLFVLGEGLAPFDHPKIDVVDVLFDKFGALPLHQLGPARGVGQHRMLDHVLANGFHQRVVGHGLHENGPVVVLGRGGDVHLQGQRAAFLQQPVAIFTTKRRQVSSNMPADTSPELSKRIRSNLSFTPTTSTR